MSEEESGADKPHEPTQKKLDEARKKGELARSNDLNTAAGYAGLLTAMLIFGAAAMIDFGGSLSAPLAHATRLADETFGGARSVAAAGYAFEATVALTPIFLVPAVFALLSVFAQQSMVFAPTKLAPKLSRISPIENAKNKFGRSGLFEFFKSFAKLSLYSIVLAVYLWLRLDEILLTSQLNPAMVTVEMVQMGIGLMTIVLVIAACLGALDYVFQVAEHQRKNRMSRKELTDEMKQSEGDPYVKQQRRERAMAIATNQMLLDVPEADVVIVNPTHYAVALKWEREKGRAPHCLAKGVDELALTIKRLARENGVAIHSDPPTARALHATVEVGEEIRRDHYRAVAVAIRFAEKMRRKARLLGTG